MNTIFQTLAHLDDIQPLLDQELQDLAPRLLPRLIQALRTGANNSIGLSEELVQELRDSDDERANTLAGGQQQDAMEFLMILRELYWPDAHTALFPDVTHGSDRTYHGPGNCGFTQSIFDVAQVQYQFPGNPTPSQTFPLLDQTRFENHSTITCTCCQRPQDTPSLRIRDYILSLPDLFGIDIRRSRFKRVGPRDGYQYLSHSKLEIPRGVFTWSAQVASGASDRFMIKIVVCHSGVANLGHWFVLSARGTLSLPCSR